MNAIYYFDYYFSISHFLHRMSGWFLVKHRVVVDIYCINSVMRKQAEPSLPDTIMHVIALIIWY